MPVGVCCPVLLAAMSRICPGPGSVRDARYGSRKNAGPGCGLRTVQARGLVGASSRVHVSALRRAPPRWTCVLRGVGRAFATMRPLR